MEVSMGNIAVNIASYKDPEILNTILDLFDKAKNPERITACVSLQHDDVSVLDKFGSKCKVIKKHPSNAEGSLQERVAIVKDLIKDSNFDYVLQVDSHSRFVYNWDDILINTLEGFNDKKVVLTGFPPNYNIGEQYGEYSLRNHNTKSKVKSFNRQYYSMNTLGKSWDKGELLFRTISVSGGFIFAHKNYFVDLIELEDYESWSDQIVYSCLGFMKGYKFVTPKFNTVFHCYANNMPGSDEKYRKLAHADDKMFLKSKNKNIKSFINDPKYQDLFNKWCLEVEKHLIK